MADDTRVTHPRLGFACVLALVCALGCALPAAAQAADIFVKRDPGLTAAERADLRADAGVRHRRMARLADSELVSVPAGDEQAALAALNADPDVRYAEPVVPFKLAASDDLYYYNQWALENVGQPLPPRGEPGIEDADMDVPEAWAVSRGAGQTVAVIDTGIQRDPSRSRRQHRTRRALGDHHAGRQRRRQRPRHQRGGRDRRGRRQ